MSLTYRHAKKLGPFRVTLTNHGVSASTGVRHAHVSASSRGRRRVSASLFGLLWRKSL